MLNCYKTYHEIPIFNFFESEKDIKYMLKTPIEISSVQEAYLQNIRQEMQEWFSKEVDQTKYNSSISSMTKIVKLKFTYEGVNTLYLAIAGFNLDVRMKDILDEDNYSNFKEQCKNLKIPFRELLKDMQSTLENFRAAYKTKIEYNLKELEKLNGNKDFNYMKSVVYLGKDLGYRINPKEVTLYEYANYINSNNGG